MDSKFKVCCKFREYCDPAVQRERTELSEIGIAAVCVIMQIIFRMSVADCLTSKTKTLSV